MQTKVATLQIHPNQQSMTIATSQDLRSIPDSQLYNLCEQYGKSARKWMREFGFLLPEVYRRKLYRKYRCSSIHMFAAKLAGMNYDVTNRILNLSEKLKDMPLLWQEFRKFGWTKLRVIADVAESTSEKFWLDKLRKLPKAALIEYVRQWRNTNNRNSDEAGPKNNLFNLVPYEKQESKIISSSKPQSGGTLKLGNEFTGRDIATNIEIGEMVDFQKSTVCTTFKKLKFRVDPETEFEFKKFKQKLEKKGKTALTMGETLKALLMKVKELDNEKSKVRSEDTPQKDASAVGTVKNLIVSHRHCRQSRHIPNVQKRTIVNQYNGKCAFPGCNEPYFELHHPDRFSIHRSHEKIYPLCRIHHQAIHAGLVKNEDQPVEQWELDYNFGRGSDYEAEFIINPKDPNSICATYDKFCKNFTDARVREYFDG